MSARFTADIKGIAARLGVKADQIKRKLALDIYSELLATTPVDTGRARAGWGISAERPGSDAPVEVTKPANWKRGNPPYYQTQTQSVPSDANVICIYNNVEYITKLNSGSSTQAPAMFVESALQKAMGPLNNV